MNDLIRAKLKGLKKTIEETSRRFLDFDLSKDGAIKFSDCVSSVMKEMNFDSFKQDKIGNVIGVIKGYENKQSLVLVSHIDTNGGEYCKFGVLTALYTGALIKRASLPLTGDLVICCVPRSEGYNFGIKYLFDEYLKEKVKNIKGVMLCEPTDFNIYLGHKGKIEYEIAVRGKINKEFLANRGINMLGSMFPLINELEKVSHTLPKDCELGSSSLTIKDVQYENAVPWEDKKEFKVVVDRIFIPEENPVAILSRAKSIGKAVYNGEQGIEVSTALSKRKIKTYTGFEIVSEKEFKPWKIESHNPLVLGSLETLKENKFKSSLGYWQKLFTEGSYTYGQLGIPTIGFGAGKEEFIGSPLESVLGINELEKAIYGQTLITYKNLGMPTFGWCADEI